MSDVWTRFMGSSRFWITSFLNGLVSGIVDKDIWGISYGVDVKVPNLGFPWGSTMHGVRNPMHSPPSDMMPSSV